jgi:hypothetical protein
MCSAISNKTKRKRGADRDSVKGPKRTPDEILRDRAIIAKLYSEDKTQAEIADEITKTRSYSISQQTIANDLKAVRNEWLSTSIENYECFKLIELARLDEEESMAKAAWARSIKPKRRREVGEVGGKLIDKTIFEEYEDGTIADRDGNPAFLARLESIRLRRCTILGFEAYQRSQNINVAIDLLLAAGYIVRLPEDGKDVC